MINGRRINNSVNYNGKKINILDRNMYLIYDLDGTLVASSRQISPDMINTLERLKLKGYKNILVTGGSYPKVKYQLQDRLDLFEMIFTESGAILHQGGTEIYRKPITDMIDPMLLNTITERFVGICDTIGFNYKGTRVDKRVGLVYLTAIGMESSDEVRSDFVKYDNDENFRIRLMHDLKFLDNDNEIDIVKGGKTGVTVVPKGIDKTQILPYVPTGTIYFFGDNCQTGGNDYPLFVHPRVNGYEVNNYEHTIELLNQLFL